MGNLSADKLVAQNQPERLPEGRVSDRPDDGMSHMFFVLRRMRGVMDCLEEVGVVRHSL
ncbi:hypothetical protein I79_019665 [Cricetulus griseus]|uniref:Uncharacterized protein n=1 Tax=Cricetulus griseus TaxID=10029 RepID=G3I808_CRIGR|nr:hypothetical protein I79_019665 [Cricetulus griseus]